MESTQQDCIFCGLMIDTYQLLSWHLIRYHRYNLEKNIFQCDYCDQTIESQDLAEHGKETCVLCQKQFQHCSHNEWQFTYMWGKSDIYNPHILRDFGFETYDKNFKDNHSKPMKNIVILYGAYFGFYCTVEQIPSGPICNTCIQFDNRLLHIYSH